MSLRFYLGERKGASTGPCIVLTSSLSPQAPEAAGRDRGAEAPPLGRSEQPRSRARAMPSPRKEHRGKEGYSEGKRSGGLPDSAPLSSEREQVAPLCLSFCYSFYSLLTRRQVFSEGSMPNGKWVTGPSAIVKNSTLVPQKKKLGEFRR